MSAFWKKDNKKTRKKLSSIEVSLYTKANSSSGPSIEEKKLLVQVHTLQDSLADCSSLRGNHWLDVSKHQPLWQTWSLLLLVVPNSFLPPYFGFFDRPEVRIIYHIVFAALCRGNNSVGWKHGVLFISAGIILDKRQKKDECTLIT